MATTTSRQLSLIVLATLAIMMLRLVFGPFSLQGVLFVMVTAVVAWHNGPRAGLLATLLGAVAAHAQRFIEAPQLLANPTALFDGRYVTGFTTYFVLSAIAIFVGRRHQHTVQQLEDWRRATAEAEAGHRQQLEAALARERAARRDAEQANQLRQELLLRLSRELARARELAAIVESSRDAIIGTDLHGTITSWNRAAESLFGYEAAEAIGQSIHLIIPADRQVEETDIMDRLSRGDDIVHFETVRRRRDGREIPISLTVSPIRDDAGTVVGASKIARDVTEQHRARSLAEYFADVSGLLSQTFDTRRTLQAVAERSVPLLGDWCALDVDTGQGDVERVASHHIDGALMARIQAFRGRYPTAPRSPYSARQVMQARRPVLVSRLTQEAINVASGDQAYRQEASGLGIGAFMIVPLMTREHAIGALTLARVTGGPAYTEADLETAEALASRLALAIDNARAHEAATQANRLKDEFLATLSHELRTPLNAIVGYVRMLNGGVLEGERLQRALAVLDRNTTALTRLVEDVLDVSRFMAGKIRLELRPTDVAAVVEQAIASTRPAAEAKGVRLDATIDTEVPPVSADPDRLQQVIWNLLSNAVKFTGRDGHVHLGVTATDNAVEILVSDTGCGISPEFLPHVFERFRQGDGRFAREHGGLGLGLAIARDLVQLHGGTIHAASAGTGEGATFRVALPLVAAARARGADAEGVHLPSAADRRSVAPGALSTP